MTMINLICMFVPEAILWSRNLFKGFEIGDPQALTFTTPVFASCSEGYKRTACCLLSSILCILLTSTLHVLIGIQNNVK